MCLPISNRAWGARDRGPTPTSRSDAKGSDPPAPELVTLTSTGLRFVTLNRLRPVAPARNIPKLTTSGRVSRGGWPDSVPASSVRGVSFRLVGGVERKENLSSRGFGFHSFWRHVWRKGTGAWLAEKGEGGGGGGGRGW